MATVQISFLGRTPGNAREGYRTTVYDYGDDHNGGEWITAGQSLSLTKAPINSG